MLNKKYGNKLCELMVKNNVDAMMIGPSVDLEFLMNYSPQPDERFQSQHSLISHLLTDVRYYQS